MTSQSRAELTEAYIKACLDKMVAEREREKEAAEYVEPAKQRVEVLMPRVKLSIYDVDRVIAAAAIVYDVLPTQIKSRVRSGAVAQARHHVTWVLHHKTGASMVRIAIMTNRLCHTSVRNSIHTFEENKHKFLAEIDAVEYELSK